MLRGRRLSRVEIAVEILDSGLLGLACLASYWLVTRVLTGIHAVSPGDEQLGGLWAVIATVFVCRFSYHQSVTAAVSRVAATTVSFALCTIYLIFLPFHLWALAVLVGASALLATLIGRAEDAITAAITSAVVVVAAGLSPHDAWQQPLFRLADTVVGAAVGVAAAWIGLHLVSPQFRQARQAGRDQGSA